MVDVAAAELNAPAEVETGRRIAVLGSRAGVGKTTIAVNLALALSRETRARVALVDFDQGDAALMLNLDATRGFMELGEVASEVDAVMLSHYALSHDSGITMYPAWPARGRRENGGQVTTHMIGAVMQLLAADFSFVIADLPARSDPFEGLRGEFDTALVAVTACTVLDIRAARLLLEGVEASPQIRVVCNLRTRRPVFADLDILESPHELFATIAADDRVAQDAVNAGVPALLSHPRSALAVDMRTLARKLTGSATQSRFSSFLRLISRG